ncbi:MAG: hypothetical protein ACRDRP_21640 [Pseudonocardiaceae bacterium]
MSRKRWPLPVQALRSEFLTAFLGTEQARLFRDPFAVGTLSRAALIEVIEQPARRAGLTFDPPALPQRMAADVGGGAALPLLAYALCFPRPVIDQVDHRPSNVQAYRSDPALGRRLLGRVARRGSRRSGRTGARTADVGCPQSGPAGCPSRPADRPSRPAGHPSGVGCPRSGPAGHRAG